MGELLGPDFLPFLLLALSGALVIGNALALVRPPPTSADQASPHRPSLRRSLTMIALGSVVSVWTIASLVG